MHKNTAHGRSCEKIEIPPTVEAVRKVPNPTHGSGWIFQVQPTTEGGLDYVVIFLFLAFARKRIKRESRGPCLCRSDLNYPPTAETVRKVQIPPTAVGGSFRSSLQREHAQITVLSFFPRVCEERIITYIRMARCSRQDLNNPPTAVGGI